MGAQQSRSDTQASQFERLKHSLVPHLRGVTSTSSLRKWHRNSAQPQPQRESTGVLDANDGSNEDLGSTSSHPAVVHNSGEDRNNTVRKFEVSHDVWLCT